MHRSDKDLFMLYTKQSLLNAIFYLIPEYKRVYESGVEFNIPMTLKSVAEKYFMEQWRQDYIGFNEESAYSICRSALLDLQNIGWMEFGNLEWSKSLYD